MRDRAKLCPINQENTQCSLPSTGFATISRLLLGFKHSAHRVIKDGSIKGISPQRHIQLMPLSNSPQTYNI